MGEDIMTIDGHIIGVCSWSLRPAGMADLVSQVKALGLSHVQLALGPLLGLDDKRKYMELGHLRASGIALTAGMIAFEGEDYASISIIRDTGGYVPDKDWPLRKVITFDAARLSAELGMKYLSTHIGFVPPSNHANYETMIGRIREIAAGLAAEGIDLLMETGQERAEELLQFLNDLAVRNVHINFDPANMVLYGAGDPIEAVQILGRHIRHVHIKDGTLSAQPGMKWGEEVPFGTGDVNPGAFLGALRSISYTGPLVIEREAGEKRFEDVKAAITALEEAAGGED
jgi:sugar phosphate isomerase/epimerase